MSDKPDPTEAAIREKMRAGLTRDQAVAVVQSQAEHDDALAEQEKTAAAAKKKADKKAEGESAGK